MYKLIIPFLFAFQTGFYSIHFTTIDGTDVNLQNFKGKKILLVNTASGSKYVSQYGSLETLYQKYKDSLVIIAFPSNDFGNESASDLQIKGTAINTFKVSYILAGKTSVSGKSISPVFKWLSSYSLNGTLENPVNGDFFKYLVDGKGQIIGVFGGAVDPMDSTIQNAVIN